MKDQKTDKKEDKKKTPPKKPDTIEFKKVDESFSRNIMGLEIKEDKSNNK
jgi:hypothetical protein